MFSIAPPEPCHSYTRIYLHHNHNTGCGKPPTRPHLVFPCLFKATPDSSGLRNPLSRTLFHYNGSFRQDPLSLSGQSNYSPLAYLPYITLYTTMCQIRTRNSDKSRNHINLRNTHISMNTRTRLLYHITQTRLASSRTRVGLPDFTARGHHQ